MKISLFFGMFILLISIGFVHGEVIGATASAISGGGSSVNDCVDDGYVPTSETKDGVTYFYCVPSSSGLVQDTSIIDKRASIDEKSSNVISVPTTDKKMWSEKGICEFMKGCFLENECYPNGYRKEGEYCSDKVKSQHSNAIHREFINQFQEGETCDNSFECQSNFCFNGKCVNQIDSLIVSIVKKISLIEGKLNILELNSNKSQTQNSEINGDSVEGKIEKTPKKGITGFIAKIFGF